MADIFLLDIINQTEYPPFKRNQLAEGASQAKVDSKVWYRVRAFRRMSPKAPPASITLISHWASYNVSTPPTPGPANTTENTDPYQSRFLAFF